MKLAAENPSDQRWWRPTTTPILVAVLGLTFILRMKFWGQPFQMDEGAHAYMGWGILQGLVPYKDMYNGKPPGIYLIHTLLFLFVKPTDLNIKIFASLYTLGTVIIVFLVARKLAGQTTGLLAALLFGVFSAGPEIQGGGVNSEVFMLLPYTLAAYSLLKAVETGSRKSFLFFGFWTGLACSFKQVAGVNIFWFGGYVLLRTSRARDWSTIAHSFKNGLWVVVGAVVPWLPFMLYLYLNDAVRQFYYWQVGSSFAYIVDGHKGASNLTILINQMKTILRENGLLWLLALVGIVWAWKRFRKPVAADPEVKDWEWQRTAWMLMATWPLFSFIGVAVSGRYYEHYFIQLIPPLAVLGGAGLAYLLQEARTRRFGFLRRPIAVLSAIGFLFFVKTDAPYYLKYDDTQVSLHQYKTALFSVTRYIGKYLKDKTQPDDLVFVWAVNSEINFYALRKSPSPYVMHTNLENVPWNAYEEVMNSLHRAPPKYIVEMQGISGFPALQDYVRKNYIAETNADLDRLKQLIPFQIFRAKGS